ncbi:hypothetical protein H8356DRAFT_1358339 [Neocallimastix lanati (nom. inval.)]|nr:hypothetical protein H8356DRAFT_1358339 [Neocallimastix sp. JGI-2020a]
MLSFSNVNTVITYMNNVESSTDSDSSNKNINIIDSENNSIITNNVVSSSIGENRINLSNFLNNEDADIIDLNYNLGGEPFRLPYQEQRVALFELIADWYSKKPFTTKRVKVESICPISAFYTYNNDCTLHNKSKEIESPNNITLRCYFFGYSIFKYKEFMQNI